MGARTLEARLTLRAALVAGAMLVAVVTAALALLERSFDTSDTAEARAAAQGAASGLVRELGEGDPPDEALREVLAEAEAERARITLQIEGPGVPVTTRSTGGLLARVPPGACSTVAERADEPFRVCAMALPFEQLTATAIAGVPTGAHRAAVRDLARAMALVLLAALAALAVGVRRALRAPLAELRALVHWTSGVVVAEGAPPPPPATTVEIVRLTTAFHSLVSRLIEALARERATSAHLAHELRTPLTAILADLDGLTVRSSATEVAELQARLRADVARMADVIDAIVLLSRSEADRGDRKGGDGDSVGARAPLVNLADLAREMTPVGCTFLGPDEALVRCDERLLGLALRNVLENAVKYGGGAALVTVTRAGGDARLTVGDHGGRTGRDPEGVSGDTLARMFDRYWRGGHDDNLPRPGGQGLGLALVRAVAERYGGQAGAAARPGGRGLDVWITLPAEGWQQSPPIDV